MRIRYPRALAPGLLLIALFHGMSCARTPAPADTCLNTIPAIIEKPVSFTDKRKALTLDYIRRHYDPGAKDILIAPKLIVIHWTAIATLETSFRCLDPEILGHDRPDIVKGGRVNVSAHFLVDRDGTVYRLMPETWMARHVIGLNHCAIGIENVGGPQWPLTVKQLEANARLVRYLACRFPGIVRVIGHHEYLSLKETLLWRQMDMLYRANRKIDPGTAFMDSLRKLLEADGLDRLFFPW